MTAERDAPGEAAGIMTIFIGPDGKPIEFATTWGDAEAYWCAQHNAEPPQTRTWWDHRDGSMHRMMTAWCGCSEDWAVVNPDHTPTDFDDGVYAHGFESEAEAAAYMREFDPKNPPAWKVEYTDEDPFDIGDL
jgi:hypothetical protein